MALDNPTPAPASPRSSGLVVPHRAAGFQRLGAAIGGGALRALTATLRCSVSDPHGVTGVAAAYPVIFCTWHNRLALSMMILSDLVQRPQPERRLGALVSASKDGALLAAILENFGVQPVRGSSSRRGPQALLELTSWAERGHDLAITPDGPRGPCYGFQPGAVALAQVTGLPLVPVTSFLHRKVRLRSWDRFQIPFPFSRCEIIFGEPVRVPREAGDAERESLRVTLERRMREATRD